MNILSIETSCDETAVSIVDAHGSVGAFTIKILGNALNSQIKLHAEFGGIYPSLAKREHAKNLVPLLLDTLAQADGTLKFKNIVPTKLTLKSALAFVNEREPNLAKLIAKNFKEQNIPKLTAIAVTVGPGLEPALWVGINFARALSTLWNIPIIPVNHMFGHMAVALIDAKNTDPLKNNYAYKSISIVSPTIALLLSGGHTQLIAVDNLQNMRSAKFMELLGETRDDAIGECYDKVARMLNLAYPGGPLLAKLAESHRVKHSIYKRGSLTFNLPRPMINTNDLDFSFSGIKTAVLYALSDQVKNFGDVSDELKTEMAREFEEAVAEVVVKKVERAINQVSAQTLVVGGGVSANTYLRECLTKLTDECGVKLLYPHHNLSTDNSIMIAIAGTLHVMNTKKSATLNVQNISADGNLKLFNN